MADKVSTFRKVQPMNPITKELIRQLYDDRSAYDDFGPITYAQMLVMLLYRVSDRSVVEAALKPREIRQLRRDVFNTCFEDVAENLASEGSADPEIYQMLAQYYHAMQLLGPPTDRDSFDDQLTYALLCLSLDRQREARDLFQKLLALQPDNAVVTEALDTVTDCLSFPRFRMSYASRCRNAWDDTARLLKDYSNGKMAQDDTAVNVSTTFQLWTGLDVELFYTSPRGGVLEFSLYQWDMTYYPAQTALGVRRTVFPKNMLNFWQAHLGDSPYKSVSLKDGSTLDFSTVQTALVDTPWHDGVHLKLYHPYLAKYASSPKLQEMLTKEVSSTLCGSDFCILILSVDVVAEKPDNCTGTIATLPQQLYDLKYTLEHPEIEVETERLLRTYDRPKLEGPLQRLREDITVGATTCWRLQLEYSARMTETADYFMERGIAPCFIAWPRSIMDCDDSAFTNRLMKELQSCARPHSMKLIGRAYGSQYCYLDMLLYDTYRAVESMEKCLSKIPGGDTIRIQSFYHDAYPCPISRTYLQEHSALRFGDVFFAFDGASQRASYANPSTPQKSKDKKKNAAKAKRKHSKKFR